MMIRWGSIKASFAPVFVVTCIIWVRANLSLIHESTIDDGTCSTELKVAHHTYIVLIISDDLNNVWLAQSATERSLVD